MRLCDLKDHQVKLGLRVHSRLSEDDGEIHLIDDSESESIYYIFWDSGLVSEGPLSDMREVEVIH